MPPATIPFITLNPNHKKWSIQGHVIAKTNIHNYTNQKDLEKLFGFDLLDCSGEEIHVNFVDSFYSRIEIGIVYIVSNGTIKATNPSYNHLNNHLEIIRYSTSTIQPFLHEFPLIPVHSFHFKKINDLQTLTAKIHGWPYWHGHLHLLFINNSNKKMALKLAGGLLAFETHPALA